MAAGRPGAWRDPAMVQALTMCQELAERGAFGKNFASINYDNTGASRFLVRSSPPARAKVSRSTPNEPVEPTVGPTIEPLGMYGGSAVRIMLSAQPPERDARNMAHVAQRHDQVVEPEVELRGASRRLHPDPRRIDRLLERQAVLDQVQDDVEHDARDEVAAERARSREWLAVFQDQRRGHVPGRTLSARGVVRARVSE